MKKKVIFHIGLEKTGTTSFQGFCAENRAVLLRHSVLYPTSRTLIWKKHHGPIAACYFPNIAAVQQTIGVPYRDKQTVLRSLNREMEKAAADTVLISSEHLSSRFSAVQIRQLAADFSDYDCRIAIVVRDHVSRALSSYCTTIESGRHPTIDEFIREICDERSNYMRYKDTITQWERVFGKDNIVMFPYNTTGNIVCTLVRSLISPEIQVRRIASYTRNKSAGASTIEALRLINKKLSDGTGSGHRHFRALKYYATYVPARIRHAVRKYTEKPARDRLLLSDDQLQRLKAIAEADRRWLEDSYRVCLDDWASNSYARDCEQASVSA